MDTGTCPIGIVVTEEGKRATRIISFGAISKERTRSRPDQDMIETLTDLLKVARCCEAGLPTKHAR
jgi:hypothetical protein